MPLKLLKHKSWNVYSEQNKERVRKDEEHARVEEEAKEQRMQEEDAAFRLSVLRNKSRPRTRTPPPTTSLAALTGSRSPIVSSVAQKRSAANGRSGLERPDEPWYISDVHAEEADRGRRERGRLREEAMDPLHLMNAYLDQTRQHQERQRRRRRKSSKQRISK